MHDYFEKNETYDGLFDKVANIKSKTVVQYLESIYQQYKKYETLKKTLDFYEKAKDKSWKITRKPLNGSLKSRPIIRLATVTNSLKL